MSARAVVIGAGPAGLVAARDLAAAGVDTTVLEAAPHVGGRTRTIDLEGSRLNTGAAFLASFYAETLPLCRELGLALTSPVIHPSRAGALREMVTPAGRYPFAPSRLGSFLRFPPVPVGQKLRVLRELVKLRLGPPLDIADPHTLAGLDDGEDAVSWARRTVGREACDYLVRPAIEPFFYVDGDQVSAAVAKALLRHATRWRPLSPARGIGTLAEALARELDVRPGCRVLAVRRSGEELWVEHEGASERADAVVVALPAPVAVALELPLSGADRDDLAAIRFAPCVVMLAGYGVPVRMPSPSTTVGGPDRHALVGLTSLAQAGVPGMVRAGADVVAVLAMGWRSRALLELDDAAVAAELRAEVARLGVELPEPGWTHIVAHRHATVIPEPGYLRRIVAFADRPRGPLAFAGDWLEGSSTVEGAVRSGHRAAASALRDLAGGGRGVRGRVQEQPA